MLDLRKASLSFRKGDFFYYCMCHNFKVSTLICGCSNIKTSSGGATKCHRWTAKKGQIHMKYVYCRVSTASQDLDLQLPTHKKVGCEKIYSEKSTGTKAGIPQFVELLPLLKKGDTLVVTKLDRFARSTEDGVNLIKELLSKRFKVHILNMGLAEDTSIGRLIPRKLSAIAKQNPNFREGRPKKFTKSK